MNFTLSFVVAAVATSAFASLVPNGDFSEGLKGWNVRETAQKSVRVSVEKGEDGTVLVLRRTDTTTERAYGIVTSDPLPVVAGYEYEYGLLARASGLKRPDQNFTHEVYAPLDVFFLNGKRQRVGSATRIRAKDSPIFIDVGGRGIAAGEDVKYAQLRIQLADGRKDNASRLEVAKAWFRPCDFQLSNPGFEEGASAPSDWETFGAAACSVDASVFRSGKRAVKVADAPDGEVSGWSRLLPVRADRAYGVSAFVKGGALNADGFVGGGAIAVYFLDAVGNAVGERKVSKAVPAMTDWTRVELKDLRVPSGAVFLRVVAGLQYCRGEAWFDDVEVTMRPVSVATVAKVTREPKPGEGLVYAQNLLRNGTLEEGADGAPVGWHYVGKVEKDWTAEEIRTYQGQGRPEWTIGRGRGKWTDEVAYAGTRSLMNVSIDPPCAARGWHGRNPVEGRWISDPMPCAPGKTYAAAGWIRPGRDLSGVWYGPLRLVFFDRNGTVLKPANANLRNVMENQPAGKWCYWIAPLYVAPKGAATMTLEFGQEFNALFGGWGTTCADNLAVWEFPGDIATAPKAKQRSAVPRWFLEQHAKVRMPYLPSPAVADEYVSVRGEGVNLTTGNTFFDCMRPVRLGLRLLNFLGEDRRLTLQMTRYDEKGRKYEPVAREVRLPGYAAFATEVEFPAPGDWGCSYVDCRVLEGAACVGAFPVRFAAMPKPTRRRTVPNPFAVTHLNAVSQETIDCSLLAGFGNVWLHPHGFLSAENAVSYERFDAASKEADEMIAPFVAAGQKIVFGVGPSGFFAAKHPRTVDYSAARTLGAFLGRKYGDKVAAFANWGVEQANSKSGYRGGEGFRVTDDEYDTLMASFYDGIKTTAPKVPVVIGNIATDFDASTVKRMYKGPGKGKFDGAAFNAYMGFGMCVANMLKVFDAHGDTAFELWSEEQCAQRSPIDGPERRYGELAGAENMVRHWVESLANSRNRLRTITIWGFERSDATAKDVFMLDRFCQPRPHFIAHAQMADFLADVRFSADRGNGRIDCHEGVRTDGTTVAVVWSTAEGATVSYRAAKAVVRDIMGRERELAAKDGVVCVPLLFSPQFVDFGGSAAFVKADDGTFDGIVAVRAKTKPSMDGGWRGWEGEPETVLDSKSGCFHNIRIEDPVDVWTNEDDASGRFKLLWDEENLYFGLAVRDDAYVPKTDAVNGFMGDAIEIAIQPQGIQKSSAPHHEWEIFTTNPQPSTLNSQPSTLNPQPSTLNPQPAIVNRRFPRPEISGDGSLTATMTRTGKGGDRVYQLAVPWKTLGVKPGVGNRIAMSFTLNDKDNPAAVFRGDRVQLNWKAGVSSKNPAQYGLVELKE